MSYSPPKVKILFILLKRENLSLFSFTNQSQSLLLCHVLNADNLLSMKCKTFCKCFSQTKSLPGAADIIKTFSSFCCQISNPKVKRFKLQTVKSYFLKRNALESTISSTHNRPLNYDWMVLAHMHHGICHSPYVFTNALHL